PLGDRPAAAGAAVRGVRGVGCRTVGGRDRRQGVVRRRRPCRRRPHRPARGALVRRAAPPEEQPPAPGPLPPRPRPQLRPLQTDPTPTIQADWRLPYRLPVRRVAWAIARVMSE